MDVMRQIYFLTVVMTVASYSQILTMDSQSDTRSEIFTLHERCFGFIAKNYEHYQDKFHTLPQDLADTCNELNKWKLRQIHNREENKKYAHKESYYHLLAVLALGKTDEEIAQMVEQAKNQEPQTSDEQVMEDGVNIQIKDFLIRLYFNKVVQHMPGNYREFVDHITEDAMSHYPVCLKQCWEESETNRKLKTICDNLKPINIGNKLSKIQRISSLNSAIMAAIEQINKVFRYDFSISEFQELRKSKNILSALLSMQNDKHLSKICMEYAILSLDLQLVKMLLDNNFDPDETMWADDATAVHQVLGFDIGCGSPNERERKKKVQKDILLMLLKMGAWGDEPAKMDSKWPLYRAIKLKRPDLAECLVKYADAMRYLCDGEENYLHLVVQTDQDLDTYASILPIVQLV